MKILTTSITTSFAAVAEVETVVVSLMCLCWLVKEWKKRAELKISFYDCITLFYLGLCSEEQQKWGERVTYCQAAVDRLNESMRLASKNDSDATAIGESLHFAMDVAGGK